MAEHNPLDAAIIGCLRDLSDSWATVSDRRATTEKAIDLLVKSGLAEVRTDITIRMDGKSDVVKASVVISGRHDLRQVTYPLLPPHWRDTSGKVTGVTVFETGDYREARLTAFGMNANHNVAMEPDVHRPIVLTLVKTHSGRPLFQIEDLTVTTPQDTPADDRTADNKTDNSKKSRKNLVPENPDVSKLAKYMKRQWKSRPNDSQKSLALEFTDGDGRKTDSLLRELRRFPHLLD